MSAPILVDQETISTIRLYYRQAKAAELMRMRMEQGLVSYARVYLTNWNPTADIKTRKAESLKALKTIKCLITGKGEPDEAIADIMRSFVSDLLPAWSAADSRRKRARRQAELLVEALPAWQLFQTFRASPVGG